MPDKKKILIVEDDFYIRDLYENYFRNSGFEVYATDGGEDGLKKTKETHPDLILLDIMLPPKMNGLEMLKTLKKDPDIASTRVILLTNLGQDTVIKQGFMLGAEGYLVKSAYTPAQIVTEVKNLLGIKE